MDQSQEKLYNCITPSTIVYSIMGRYLPGRQLPTGFHATFTNPFPHPFFAENNTSSDRAHPVRDLLA